MEEFMIESWTKIVQYVDVVYMLTFIFLSYTITKYFGTLLQKLTKFEWRTAYTVFIIATLTAIPFIIWTDTGWVKVLFSYAAGTSLYEIAFKFIGNKLKNVDNNK